MIIDDHYTDDGENLAGSQPNELFVSLVRNAIDFLKKSVDELEGSPKYSVIHFCSAIELFLKARLLVEHWTLIIIDINKMGKRNKKPSLQNSKKVTSIRYQ